ncbi:MAG TPA: D-alanyl-D-alanine carboxypeptidase family protein [Caulobacteraceae bacterium]|nr:D-alanyl-D-alanine carboxypeptidase family protein [Caulobacteraceae bacterium]
MSSGLVALGLAGCAAFALRHELFGDARNCAWPGIYEPAARANAASIATLPLNVFGRDEAGWAPYAPAIAHAAGTACPAATPGFAWSLAYWQFRHGLTPHGAVDQPTVAAMKAGWQRARPFVRQRESGAPCPDPPTDLVALTPEESRADRPVVLRPAALAALRRMVAAARREQPEIAADPKLLTVFSGYRDPVADAVRCEAQENCQGLVRATCSAHRTGLAVDLYLGSAPGFAADSSDPANRLYQSRTPAYRWLVANAGRFGFVNYVYEPWHWEWTGAQP